MPSLRLKTKLQQGILIVSLKMIIPMTSGAGKICIHFSSKNSIIWHQSYEMWLGG